MLRILFIKITPTIILLSFIFVLMFGLNMTMHMNEDGSMSDCPFMGQASFCQMSIFEHLTKFQAIFITTTPHNNHIYLLTSILFTIAAIFIGQLIISNLSPPKQLLSYSHKLQGINFNGFLLAISDGIIQPKLYA